MVQLYYGDGKGKTTAYFAPYLFIEKHTMLIYYYITLWYTFAMN